MSLTLQIGADVQGAVNGIKKVNKEVGDLARGSLLEAQATVKRLKGELASLDAQALKSKTGRYLASELRVASSEMKNLERQAGITGQATASAFNQGFSAVRQLAYVLPGIGIAGILGGLSDLVVGLFKANAAFSESEITAGKYAAALDRIQKSAEDLKDSLDFSASINKLNLELQGLSGFDLKIGGGKIDVQNSIVLVKTLDDQIKRLKESNKALLADRIKFEQTVQAAGGKPSTLSKLFTQFGGVENIPSGLISKVSTADQALVKVYQDTNKTIQSLTKQREEARQSGITSIYQMGVDEVQKQKKLLDDQKKNYEAWSKEMQRLEEERARRRFALTQLGPLERISEPEKESEKLDKYFDQYNKSLTNLFKPFDKNLSKMFEKGFEDIIEGFRKKSQEMQRMAEYVAGNIANAFGDAFDEIARGENVFDAISQAVKKLVIDMIKAAIQAFIFQTIMNAILPGSGALHGIPGLPGFGGARAGGGSVSGGKSYLIGERGPELFVPNTSGSIVPSNQLNGIAGGAMQSLMLSGKFEVEGQNLALVLSRVNKYNKGNV